MKTPKNAKGSPDAKLHAVSGGSMKKSANASFKNKKLSLKDPQHAWDAVSDKSKFTPVAKNQKKSINGIENTPKTDPINKQKGKKSFQKGSTTPVPQKNSTPNVNQVNNSGGSGKKQKNKKKSLVNGAGTPEKNTSPINKAVNGSGGSGKKQKNKKKSLINGSSTPLSDESKTENKSPKGPQGKTPKTVEKINQKKNVKNQGTPLQSQPKAKLATPVPQKQKRKSDGSEASPKQNKKFKKSPEVKLGLKIEKLLDKSPLSSKQNQKTKNSESGSPAFINKMTVTGAVKALLKRAETQAEKESNLFNTPQDFLIQINFLKVPVAEKGIIRICLPHSRATESTSVCLITADLSGAKKNNHDEAVQHYKDILSANGVKGISEVIPFRQLKTEYTQFEQKRKLANSHDIFLIDSKLGHRTNTVLKKSIMNRKIPVPVKLAPAKNLCHYIDVAMRKVPLLLKPNGLTYATTFGHSGMKLEHLVDNIMEIAKVLGSPVFKTGSENFASIFIKTPKGEAFPIFWSNASPNKVKEDITTKAKSAKNMPVTDELSTFIDTNVTVHPDGRVTTKKIKNAENKKNKKVKKPTLDDDTEDEEDESFDKSKYNLILKGDYEDDDENDDLDSSIDDDDDEDDDDDDESDEEEIQAPINGLKKSKNNQKKPTEDETSSDEEEIEAAEQAFLKELRDQQAKIQAGKKVKGKPQNVKTNKVEKEIVPKKDLPPKKGAAPPKKGAVPPKKGPAPPKNAAMKVGSPIKKDNKNKKPNMSPSPKGQQKPNVNKAQKQKMNKKKRNSNN